MNTTVNLIIYEGLLTPRMAVTSNIEITSDDSTIFMSASLGITGATNIGGDVNGLFKETDGSILLFKNLAAGSLVSLVTTDSTIMIDTTSIMVSGTTILSQVSTSVVLSTIVSFPSPLTHAPVVNYSFVAGTSTIFQDRFVSSYLTGVSTTSFTLNTVMKGTYFTVIDSTGDVGQYASMAIMRNGCPAIAYKDVTNNDLKFTRNTSPDGGGAWITVVVESSGNTGNDVSLAILNDGTPAISYNNNSDFVYFARNSLQDGSGTWTTILVDNTSAHSDLTSLTVLSDGTPGISYYSSSSDILMFSRNTQVDGFGTWSGIVVDGVPNVGLYSSLVRLSDGTPGIAYKDSTNSDLKFARNTLPTGLGVWTNVVVESSGSVGDWPSMAVLSNATPAIAYRGTSGLRFATNSASNGLGTWSVSTFDTGTNSQPSLTVLPDGNPAVSYYNTAENLKFARNSLSTGLGTWSINNLGRMTGINFDVSMQVLSVGTPAIAFYDFAGPANLNFVRSALNSSFPSSNASFVLLWTAT